MSIQSIFLVMSLSHLYAPAGPTCVSRSASLPLVSSTHFNHGDMNPFGYSTPSMIAYDGALTRTFLASSWPSGRILRYRYSTSGVIHVRLAGAREFTRCSSMLLSLSTYNKTILDKWPKHVDGKLSERFNKMMYCLHVLFHLFVFRFEIPIDLIGS